VRVEAENLSLNALLVPTARLELAQLSPLPPQDSVSTNFTTSAFQALLCSPIAPASGLEARPSDSLTF
jgi:hypothetical protein